jgi:hypothetical protein
LRLLDKLTLLSEDIWMLEVVVDVLSFIWIPSGCGLLGIGTKIQLVKCFCFASVSSA